MATTHTITLVTPGNPTLTYDLLLPPSTPAPTNLALVAHPYGRLGGSRHDHVVMSLARELVKQGWGVCTYDARGAGDSVGAASWSGVPEAEDYEALVNTVLLPLFPPTPTQPLKLLLAGYSFGSLAASSCPTPSFPQPIQTYRLLISYPLSVTWALTLFRSSTFTSALDQTVAKGQEDVLAIWGDQDQFTAVGKFRSWDERVKGVDEGRGKWSGREVEGADHFWRTREVKREMLQAVVEWLEK